MLQYNQQNINGYMYIYMKVNDDLIHLTNIALNVIDLQNHILAVVYELMFFYNFRPVEPKVWTVL